MNMLISILVLLGIGCIAYKLVPNFFINLLARLRNGGKIIWFLAKDTTKVIWPLAKDTAVIIAAKEQEKEQEAGLCVAVGATTPESVMTKSHPTDPPYSPPIGIDKRKLFTFLYERAWRASDQYKDKKWNALIWPTIESPALWSYVNVQTEKQMKLRKYVTEEAARLKKEFEKTLPPGKHFDFGTKGEAE
jgi:hypothetical protein